MLVRNNNDARLAFDLINFVNNYAKEHPAMDLRNSPNIIDTKRKLRAFINKPKNESIVKDYGIDGYISLIRLPEKLETEEAARDYFKEEEYLVCRPSQCDCTGQAFTCWYKLFKRQGNWMAYHRIAFDV